MSTSPGAPVQNQNFALGATGEGRRALCPSSAAHDTCLTIAITGRHHYFESMVQKNNGSGTSRIFLVCTRPSSVTVYQTLLNADGHDCIWPGGVQIHGLLSPSTVRGDLSPVSPGGRLWLRHCDWILAQICDLEQIKATYTCSQLHQ